LDNQAVSANSVAKHNRIDGSNLSRNYKEHLSGFREWEQLAHAGDWVLFPENMGARLCLDEVALSEGELYTVLTNAKARCQEGSLIAMVKGIKSKSISKVFNQVGLQERKAVQEISVDMANSMEKVCADSFPNAAVVTDRFHVAKLVGEAVQQARIKYRWEAIEEENKAVKKAKSTGEKYLAPTFKNGDTRKQLLARSRYLLFKPEAKWTRSQAERSGILFGEYPLIHEAYKLSMMFRSIYENAKDKRQAEKKLSLWHQKVKDKKLETFTTAAESIHNHKETILNFFNNRTTNALAESFNSKIKAFRSMFRGIRDLEFFIYRVSLIFA